MRCTIFVVLVACGCAANKQPDNFDRQSFASVAELTMYKLSRTSPNEVSTSNPFTALEALCAGYTFSPDTRKTELMDLLYIGGMKDPMWTSSPGNSHTAFDQNETAVLFSRRQADFAYQMCMNGWREHHGKEFIPIKLQPSSYYKKESWSS